MATLRDIATYSWEGMLLKQKLVLGGIGVLLLLIAFTGWVDSCSTSREVRRLEREANAAKRDAEKHLATAAKIAREKLEMERKLTEIEAKRDAKITEAEAAQIETLDARSEYLRALRERRGDDPSTEQLCAELRALGYPCS